MTLGKLDETALNALVAKLIHMTTVHGRDWRSGRPFVLHNHDEFAVLQDCIEPVRAARSMAALLDRIEELHGSLTTALVAMKIAAALPGVADEYDFSEAIAAALSALEGKDNG